MISPANVAPESSGSALPIDEQQTRPVRATPDEFEPDPGRVIPGQFDPAAQGNGWSRGPREDAGRLGHGGNRGDDGRP